MRKYFFLSWFFFFSFISPAFAQTDRHYVTLVNPVRSKVFWQNSKIVSSQIGYIVDKKVPVTWLIQYSILLDPESKELFYRLSPNHEIGILLEIDENLASDSLVPYKIGVGDWARADKVLLSGYFPSERKRMIDTVFSKFKSIFGYYPSSVGAWYIDTLSLDYMVDKYQIKAVLNVSDQYQTDTYGIWGTPWGTPYYPSRLNSLLPATSFADKLNAVKIQWAQRDPVRGYGLTVSDSTYSVQANDYISHHNLSTLYFKKLIDEYLFSDNILTQITVGLEVGQEMVDFFEEYKKQVDYLRQLENDGKLQFVTMSDFASKYNDVYPQLSGNMLIEGFDIDNSTDQAFWYSTLFYRIGLIKRGEQLSIRDLRIYKSVLSDDIFRADSNTILRRDIFSAIDDAKRQDEKIILGKVKRIDTEKSEDKMNLKILSEDGNYSLLLLPDRILIDQKVLFGSLDNSKNIAEQIRKKVSLWLIDLYKKRPHKWKAGFRYTYVNGSYYFGIMTAPGELIGLKSTSPFVGRFNFPFQVLTHFKTLPDLDLIQFMLQNFINLINNSTINSMKDITI